MPASLSPPATGPTLTPWSSVLLPHDSPSNIWRPLCFLEARCCPGEYFWERPARNAAVFAFHGCAHKTLQLPESVNRPCFYFPEQLLAHHRVGPVLALSPSPSCHRRAQVSSLEVGEVSISMRGSAKRGKVWGKAVPPGAPMVCLPPIATFLSSTSLPHHAFHSRTHTPPLPPIPSFLRRPRALSA